MEVKILEKEIFLDRHIIEASDNARVTVLERERKLIKDQFEKLFKKQIQDLEANILAYQDLLMTKEIKIKMLEQEALERSQVDTNALTVEITNLKQVLQEKLQIIEELRQKVGVDWCEDHQSDDDLTSGTCTRAKMKRRVYKKIEHLNEFIRNEVTPEIHQRYAVEIESLIKRHQEETEQMTKAHVIELRNVAQAYELKIKESALEIGKLNELNRN